MGGVWCEKPEVVRREALKLYEARFSTSQDFGVRLDNLSTIHNLSCIIYKH